MRVPLKILISCFLALAGSPLNGQVKVVATTPDLGAIARSVGREWIEVTSLAKGTEDPHYVDPKPSFVRVLNQADLLIDGGAGLESGWLSPLVDASRNRKIVIGQPGRLQASAGLKLLQAG